MTYFKIPKVPEEYVKPISRCLCHGVYPGQAIDPNEQRAATNNQARHMVWVAFLLEDNEEGEEAPSFGTPAWLRHYLSFNWLVTLITGHNFIHTQMVFWDAKRQGFYTYSVDGVRPVYARFRKTFARGWEFIELKVTEAQELMLHNFHVAQRGKHLNRGGQLLLFLWGQPGYGRTWFCSELVAAALHFAGIVNFRDWPGCRAAHFVAPHHLFRHLLETCPVECRLLEGNPVVRLELLERRRKAGKIKVRIQDDGQLALPPPMDDFSEEEERERNEMAEEQKDFESLVIDRDDDSDDDGDEEYERLISMV